MFKYLHTALSLQTELVEQYMFSWHSILSLRELKLKFDHSCYVPRRMLRFPPRYYFERKKKSHISLMHGNECKDLIKVCADALDDFNLDHRCLHTEYVFVLALSIIWS